MNDITPYDVLTEADRHSLYNYITYVGEGSLDEASLPLFLSSWNSAKQSLLPLFKDENGEPTLIVRRAISFTKLQALISKEIADIVRQSRTNLITPLHNLIRAWLEEHEMFRQPILNRVDDLFFPENLSNNALTVESANAFIDVPTPQGNRIRITKDCKPMRIIGKLVRAFAPDLQSFYEQFRIEISQALNVAHLEGELCLSIHPLDYLTMSDNDCDWQSCMSWAHDGEYKKGTLEMLGSPYCVVAYLQANTPYRFIGSASASNKKWRQLLFIHPGFICGNRHYPYEVPELEEIAMRLLKEAAINAGYSSYSEERIQLKNKADNTILGSKAPQTVYLELTMDDMYNDLSTNYYYLAIEPFLKEAKPFYCAVLPHRLTFQLNLSGEARCINCGEPIGAQSLNPSLLVCEDCANANGYICNCCDQFFYDEEPYFTNSDGQGFCRSCYEDGNLSECDICEEMYCQEDIFYYDLVNEEGEEVSSVYACPICVNTERFKKLFGFTNKYGQLTTTEISEEGRDILDWRGKGIEE